VYGEAGGAPYGELATAPAPGAPKAEAAGLAAEAPAPGEYAAGAAGTPVGAPVAGYGVTG
jgi:hypothetical protein